MLKKSISGILVLLIFINSKGSEIHGFEYFGEQKSMVVIHAKDVSLIEINRLDVGLIILTGCVCLGAIIFKGIIIPVPPF